MNNPENSDEASYLAAYMAPVLEQIRTQGHVRMIIPPGTPGRTSFERTMNYCAWVSMNTR